MCTTPQNDWEITGIVNSHNIKLSGIKVVKADLTDKKTVDDLFAAIQPDGVIHTAAVAVPGYCQQHPEETHKINVSASIHLVQNCASRKIPFVFTSTDLVFDGNKGDYKETDPVSPVNKYGEQKAIAEEKIMDLYPEAAICRMPLMLGESGPVATSYLQSFLECVKQGSDQKLFIDEYRSVLGGKSAAQGLFLALNQLTGIYHLGGRDKISRYDLGLMLARIFNLPEANIIPTKLEGLQFSTPRSPNVTLDNSKAYEAGFDPKGLEEEIKLIAQT